MLGTLDLEEAAKNAVGNWQKFNSFVWWREVDDADRWAIIYTHNRDSGLLDQSNAAVVRTALEPFTEGDDPDVVMESHNHWAVGHVDGFSIRVFRNSEITQAFQSITNSPSGWTIIPFSTKSITRTVNMRPRWKTSRLRHGV